MEFKVMQYGSWKCTDSHAKFVDLLCDRLKISTPEDWYRVTSKSIQENGGNTLMTVYGGSFIDALYTLYPEYQWQPWRFKHVTRGFWDNLDNQVEYLEWTAEQLGIRTPDDWYRVPFEELFKRKGSSLLTKIYRKSMNKMLMTVYPEFPWKPWKFRKIATGFFDDDEHQTHFLRWLEGKLFILNEDDWYDISLDQLVYWKAGCLIKSYDELAKMLTRHFKYPWKEKLFANTEKSQKFLCRAVKSLFHRDTEVQMNAALRSVRSGASLMHVSLDVFVPCLSLALEYQGEQHYEFTSLYGSPSLQHKRDRRKSILCKDAGISLVPVPYSWDHERKSLIEMIAKCRPDIVCD